MLDNFSHMVNRTYESTCSIDFVFLQRIGVREDFLCLITKEGFTYQFWTIHDKYQVHVATIEFLSSFRLMKNDRRYRYRIPKFDAIDGRLDSLNNKISSLRSKI
jgi:hypothetical protein